MRAHTLISTQGKNETGAIETGIGLELRTGFFLFSGYYAESVSGNIFFIAVKKHYFIKVNENENNLIIYGII